MRSLLPALLIATTVLVMPVRADDGFVGLKAEQVGQIFCLSRLGSDEGPVTGLLSPDLEEVIGAAWARNDAWEATNPGEKPPLGDGIPWQAWPDYAAECTVGLATLMKTDARVEISYGFPEAPDADFTDMLILKRIEDATTGLEQWRIDNIVYATGGDLRTAIDQAFQGL